MRLFHWYIREFDDILYVQNNIHDRNTTRILLYNMQPHLCGFQFKAKE